MAKGRLAVLEDAVLALKGTVEAYKPQSGQGITVTDAAGGSGRIVNLARPGAGAGGGRGAGSQFWEILPGAPDMGGNGTVKMGPNNPLRFTQTLNDIVTITDIGNSFTPAADQVLYIELDYTGPTYTLKMTDRWVSYSLPYTTDGGSPPSITKAYYLIGYVADTSDTVAAALDGPVVTLADTTQLKVARTCYAPLILQYQNMGSGFIIPFPDPPSVPGPS